MKDAASPMVAMFSGDHPHLVEIANGHVLKSAYDFGDDFEFGLGLILDGLSRRTQTEHEERTAPA